MQSNAEGLDLVVEAIAKAGYTGKVVIGMDVAASEFFTKDKVRRGCLAQSDGLHPALLECCWLARCRRAYCSDCRGRECTVDWKHECGGGGRRRFVACQRYDLDFKTAGNDGSKVLSGSQLTDLYRSFVEKYPIVSIEDPFDQVRVALVLYD